MPHSPPTRTGACWKLLNLICCWRLNGSKALPSTITKRYRSESLQLPCTPALLSNTIIRKEAKLISRKKCHPISSETSAQYLKYVFSNSKDNLSANFTFLKMQFIKLRSNTDAMFSPRIVLTNFSLSYWFPKQHIILYPHKYVLQYTIHGNDGTVHEFNHMVHKL